MGKLSKAAGNVFRIYFYELDTRAEMAVSSSAAL